MRKIEKLKHELHDAVLTGKISLKEIVGIQEEALKEKLDKKHRLMVRLAIKATGLIEDLGSAHKSKNIGEIKKDLIESEIYKGTAFEKETLLEK